MNCKVGDIAISTAGHDIGNKYLIIDKKDKFVLLSDGKLKKLDNLKKKNIKHIQIINIDSIEAKRLLNEDITNEKIKYFLKAFGGKNV